MSPCLRPAATRAPRLRCALLVAALTLPGAAHAQGRTATPLLVLPASARAAALGDAYVAAGGDARDAASLFSNPAQLATLRSTTAALSIERYLASSTLGALAIAHPVRRVVVGTGVLTLDYPDAEEVLPDAGDGPGVPTGARVSAHDLVAVLGVAAGGSRLRVGASAKYVGQFLPGASGATMAVDLGVAGQVAEGAWGRVDVAVAAQHLGGDVATGTTVAPLPRTWRAGASLALPMLAHARWAVLAEVVAARDADVAGRAGIEGAWTVAGLDVAARGGWAAQPEGALARPFTLGAGLRRERLWLDYAWRRFAETGDTHRIGIRWRR